MYIKENKKGKPTTLRFIDLQVSIAMTKSGKQSKQQLFDWLLDRYVNGEDTKFYDFGESKTLKITPEQHIVSTKSAVRQKTEIEFLNIIAELQFEDEYKSMIAEINSAFWLSDKVKQRLITNMRTPKI